MLMKAVPAALVMLALARPASQAPPDIFSCLVPSRLTSGTTTYDLSGPRAEMVVAPVNDGGQIFTQVVWRPTPTSAFFTNARPDTLVPVRLHGYAMSESGERRPVIDISITDAEIRGTAGARSVTIPTGGDRTVAGGPYFLEVLASAVDWERCPAVTARHMVSYQLVTTNLRRVAANTLSHQGMPVPVFEIEITRPGQTSKAWVTRNAPHFVMQFTSGSGSLVTFVSRQSQ